MLQFLGYFIFSNYNRELSKVAQCGEELPNPVTLLKYDYFDSLAHFREIFIPVNLKIKLSSISLAPS
jgi:hypothetical protein